MGDGRVNGLMQDIINKVNEISEISDYIFTVRKPFFSLARRLKILIPFFEEIRDHTHRVRPNLYYASISLFHNLEITRKLLRQGSQGSKIYLVLERKQIMREYEAVAARLEKDLYIIFNEDRVTSTEVKEHAAVVLSQFKRARGKIDEPDHELYEDLFVLYDKGTNVLVDPLIFKGLVETLELTESVKIEVESQALTEMVTNSGGDPRENIEKMLMVLKLIKDFVQGGNQRLDKSLSESPNLDISARQGTVETNYDNKAMPNEFICPISLQLMQDPVIISSGQTYERTSIATWIKAGNGICPKTRQILENKTLTPNFALRSLIIQWCETNGINPPKRSSLTSSCCTPTDHALINRYVQQLMSNELDQSCIGAGEISIISKRNSETRAAIVEAGAIPLLVKLLQKGRDPRAEEYAMIALLNLSISEENKERIVSSGGIPIIIEVMMNRSIETCEHGAAVLYSLAVNDDRRSLIGSCGGIKPLVWLLGHGTERGNKDAAIALYSLLLYPGNKARAVREGIVVELMNHIREPQGGMKDEALVLLDMIKKRYDTIEALDVEDPVGHLVNIVWTGSRMNQEHAASVLLELCCGDRKHLEEAKELGVEWYLVDMKDYGSDRGKKKARQLLEMITAYTQERKRARKEPNAGSGSGSQSSRSQVRPRDANLTRGIAYPWGPDLNGAGITRFNG